MTLLSTREVADHYGKTDREVRYAIQVGMLKPIKIGHGLGFEKEKLPENWTIRSKCKNCRGNTV